MERAGWGWGEPQVPQGAAAHPRTGTPPSPGTGTANTQSWHQLGTLGLMPSPGLQIKSQSRLEGKKGFFLSIYFKDL